MGGICKLIIKAYADDAFSSEKGEFKSSVNPSNLRITNNVNYSSSQMMGGKSAGLRYNTSDPQELSFSLIFDNSGVFVDNKLPVKDQIECLQKVVLDYQKDINEPFFVRVIWGTIDFKGKLKKFNISYTQFQIDGTPIRAEVDMSILEYKASMHNKGKSGDGANTENKSNENTAEGKSGASGGSGGNQGGDNNGNNNGSNSSANSGNNSNKAGDNVNDGTNSSGENNGNNNSTNNKGGDNAGGNNGSEKNVQNQANKTQPTDVGPVKQVQPGAGTTLSQLNGGVKNLDLLGKFNALSAIRGMIGGLIAGLAIPALLAGLLAWLLAKLVELIKRGISFIKKKASKAKDKAKDGGKKITGKTKEGDKKVDAKTKSGAKTKSSANKTAELFKKARK